MIRSWSGRYRRGYARPERSLFRKFLDIGLAMAIFGLLLLISARLDRVEVQLPTAAAIVNDGDSLTLGAQRIRLRGIDAPEYAQTCVKNGENYACGRRSREALAKLIGGKSVSCSGWEHDRYGRLLAECTAAGVNLNRMQVTSGWAVAYGDYLEEEAQARQKKLGLWAGPFDRPRDWRDSHGGLAENEHRLKGSIIDWIRRVIGFS